MSGGVAHGERERQASPLVSELPLPSRLPLQGQVRAEEQEGEGEVPAWSRPISFLKGLRKKTNSFSLLDSVSSLKCRGRGSNDTVRVGLTDKVTFEQRPEGGEGQATQIPAEEHLGQRKSKD